jgi:hypothetical protein
VLAGLLRIGGIDLALCDYRFTHAGDAHGVVALSDATIFVASQKATPVLE